MAEPPSRDRTVTEPSPGRILTELRSTGEASDKEQYPVPMSPCSICHTRHDGGPCRKSASPTSSPPRVWLPGFPNANEQLPIDPTSDDDTAYFREVIKETLHGHDHGALDHLRQNAPGPRIPPAIFEEWEQLVDPRDIEFNGTPIAARSVPARRKSNPPNTVINKAARDPVHYSTPPSSSSPRNLQPSDQNYPPPHKRNTQSHHLLHEQSSQPHNPSREQSAQPHPPLRKRSTRPRQMPARFRDDELGNPLSKSPLPEHRPKRPSDQSEASERPNSLKRIKNNQQAPLTPEEYDKDKATGDISAFERERKDASAERRAKNAGMLPKHEVAPFLSWSAWPPEIRKMPSGPGKRSAQLKWYNEHVPPSKPRKS